MVERLIVPLDGRRETLAAFPVAEALAKRLSASLTALVVAVPAMGSWEDEIWLKEHATSDEVPVDRVVVLADDVVGTILGRAEDPGAVLCLSSHGRTGVGAALLGSVSEEVLGRSTKEVVVVGPRTSPPAELDAVLICVDDETSASVVEAGRRWAEALGARPVVVTAERTDGDPATTLLDRAERERAGLVVAGAHQHVGFERFLLGSVSQALVRRSTVPVLLVNPAAPA